MCEVGDRRQKLLILDLSFVYLYQNIKSIIIKNIILIIQDVYLLKVSFISASTTSVEKSTVDSVSSDTFEASGWKKN